MLKWMVALGSALMLAGGVHALAVLSLPYLADTGIPSQIANAELPANQFYRREALEKAGVRLGGVDQSVKVAVCPIELSQSPISVYAPLFAGYWSISIFDDEMNNIAVFNKSSFLNQSSEIVVGVAARDALLASDDSIISVILPEFTGYALLRTMQGFDYHGDEAEEVFARSRCQSWSR